MKKIVLLGLLCGQVVFSDNGYYEGAMQSMSEYGTIHYTELRKYSVVVDGEDISSDNLLFLKGVGKKLMIPNIQFINHRFLIFGDYNRLADANKARAILKKVTKDDIAVRVAESAVFGKNIVTTPIMINAFRDSTKSYKEHDVYMADREDGAIGQYSEIPKSFPLNNETSDSAGGTQLDDYYYDNSGWDKATKETIKASDISTSALDEFKNANIDRGFVRMGDIKLAVDQTYSGYKLIAINASDNSFLIKSVSGPDTFMIENNRIIKM